MARPRLPRRSLILCACIGLLHGSPVRAEDPDSEIRTLRQQIETLLRRDAEQQRRIEDLERRLGDGSPAAPSPSGETAAEALDRAVEEATAERPPPAAPSFPALASRGVGPANLKLLDLSLDLLAAAGGSSEDDETLRELQGGGHDPRRTGFTLQQVELSAMGAVDPYFTGESHVLFILDPESGETAVELEEAFATTQALPHGLQVEAGHFLTEFGRINPTHPHGWSWLDQPVINTRLFGGDGMRNPGFRVGWLLPVPWFAQLHLGMQDASGETMASFLGGSVAHSHGEEEHAHEEEEHAHEEEEGHAHEGEEPVAEGEPTDPDHPEEEHAEELEPGIAGRPIVGRSVRQFEDFVYLARLENGFDLSDEWSGKIGVSGLFGPNASGEDGRTRIYGADAIFKWRPADNFRGWPFFLWQSEIMRRDFRADRFLHDDGDVLFAKKTLHDWGFYSQGLIGFAYGWAAGVRAEYASGDGATAEIGRDADPFRGDRLRLSPLAVYHPSEFSRLRLQYNFDDADHLERDAHGVWVGLEILYGAHPAHAY